MAKDSCMTSADKIEHIVDDKICRYCLKGELEDHLIAPCACKGTQKFVHQKCLLTWILQPYKNIDDGEIQEEQVDSAPKIMRQRCEVCHDTFLGGWQMKFHPRLSWKSSVAPCLRIFVVIICIFNFVCFVLSMTRIIRQLQNASQHPSLLETIADWLDVGLFLVGLTVLIGLVLANRCPLIIFKSHRWIWSIGLNNSNLQEKEFMV